MSADISEFAEKYEEGEADEYFYNVVYDELAYELPVIDDEWLKQDENWMNDDMQYRKLMSAACECEDSLAGLSFDRYQPLYAQSGSEWLGFPSAEGGSSYIYSSCLYVNNGSENAEGAKEFLAYLISKEGQKEYARITLKRPEWETLTVSTGTLDKYIKAYNEEITSVEKFYVVDGVKVRFDPLTDEMVSFYKTMIQNAHPIKKELAPIEEIIEEELGAFLEDQKTAEETAKIIDSRVQLFLDETKN